MMPSDSIKPRPTAKPTIFVSYAHADEPENPRGEEVQWLSFVMKFLRPAVKSGDFTVWVDRQMPGGTKWDPEIERHLRRCDIFVLLVSANSMGSDYIIDRELEIARKRQAAGELHVYPLLIEPTPKAGLEKIQDFNLRPRTVRPFQSYSRADRNQHMSDAADEIAEIAAVIAAGKEAATPSKPAVRGAAFVHIGGLPETFYDRLVGREDELGGSAPNMPPDSTKPIIFISYAHDDGPEHNAKWLSFVCSFLDPGEQDGAFVVWTDRLMRGGEDWNKEIEQKLRACDIFVVLVSRHSTSSKYIVEKEIAIIRERQVNEKNVHFYPLLLSFTPKAGLKKVQDKNLRPRGARPFLKLSRSKREEEMCEIADELEEIATEITARRNFEHMKDNTNRDSSEISEITQRKIEIDAATTET
jgi:hypothetical protein